MNVSNTLKLFSGVSQNKWFLRLVLMSLYFLFSYLSISSMQLDSATFDEPVHIASGYIKLKYGYFDYFKEQPPLLDSLSVFPLLYYNINFDSNWKKSDQWDFGKNVIYKLNNDPDTVLFLTRLPNVFIYLLLCILIYHWIYKLTKNRYAALFGFAITGFCPNLLAHARLVTGDIGVTLCITLATFFFLRYLYEPNNINTILTGISMAFAFMSKVSGLILIPYFAVLFFIFAKYESRLFSYKKNSYVMKKIIIIVVILVCIEIMYLIELNELYIQNSYPKFYGSLWGRLSIPFIEYMNCIESVYQWVTGKGPLLIQQYLLGSFSATGWWYYYFIAFLLKTPLSTIILFIVAIGLFISIVKSHMRHQHDDNMKYVFHMGSLLLFIILYFIVTLNNKINIGLRYILPIYPFMYLFIALVLAYAYSVLKKSKKLFIIIMSILFLWNILSNAVTYPSYISYFNEIVRNHKDADKYLVDSNLDWGQDLKRLALWVNDNNIPKIYTIYFGGGDPSYYLGGKSIILNTVTFPKQPGYYAVSRHLYRMSTNPKWYIMNLESYFKDAEYVTTIGDSINIYKF